MEGCGVLEFHSFEELIWVGAEYDHVGFMGDECTEHELCTEFVHAWLSGDDFVCEFFFGAEFGGVDAQRFGGEEGFS